MSNKPGSDEFSIIGRYFAPLSQNAPGALNLTDDAATVPMAAGHEAVLTADGMVENVHFRRTDGAEAIARKLLRVNLSDLASEGARPIGYLLVAAWPREIEEGWIADFAKGLARDQAEFGVSLLGGDTVSTSGPLSFSLTALGSVAQGTALRRNGAKAGDHIFVSGTIGDAGLALALEREPGDWPEHAALKQRLHLPTPRLALGQALVGIATACIDISDGLAQDIAHIAEASKLRCCIEATKIPLSDSATAVVSRKPELMHEVFAGGDDYELAFTVPADRVAKVPALAAKAGVSVQDIGRVEAGEGLALLDARGEPIALKRMGYRHF